MTAPKATSGLGRAIRATAVEIRDALAGQAGLAASIDAGQVPVPGAWVSFQSATVATMSGYSLRFHVYLIVAEGETFQVLDQLGGLATAALEVIDAEEEPVIVSSVTLPANPFSPLPAFRLVCDQLVDLDDFDEE